MPQPLFSCSNVRATINKVALAVDSFKISPGDLIVIGGKSGAGVSELLLLLGGFADAGHTTAPASPGRLTRQPVQVDLAAARGLCFAGRPLYDIERAERAKLIGFVFENPEVGVFGRTVAEDLRHALASVSMDTTETKAVELLVPYGLAALSSRPTKVLSGGELQRLNCATALCRRPRLLIADFTNSNLDEEFLAAFCGWVDSMREGGMAAVVAGAAPALFRETRRYYYIERGRAEEVSSLPEEVCSADWQAERLRGGFSERQTSAQEVCNVQGVFRPGATAPASFQAHVGEVAVLRGRNGSGKTTLCNVLAGRLSNPRMGAPRFEGRSHVIASARPVMSLQFPERSFLSRSVLRELPDTGLLEQCGLERHRHSEDPLRLSRSTQKLLATATALRLSGDLTLLDEPTCGMDFDDKVRFVQLLNAFPKKAVVIASHDRAFDWLGSNVSLGG